jgi:hypothetical protein
MMPSTRISQVLRGTSHTSGKIPIVIVFTMSFGTGVDMAAPGSILSLNSLTQHALQSIHFRLAHQWELLNFRDNGKHFSSA